jgi:hypothetical protein
MKSSQAGRRPSHLDRLLARLGRSLVAWGDPFRFESGLRCSNHSAGPASRAESAAVAEALARLAASEASAGDPAASARALATAIDARR